MEITVTTAGTVSVTVSKAGISATAQNVTVHKEGEETPDDITWTAEADGTSNTATSTKITFIFSEAVNELTESDITLTDGTGSATKGTLSGSGKNWDLGITVASAGTVSVTVTKTGVSATAQNVTVHKKADDEEPPPPVDSISNGSISWVYDATAYGTYQIAFSTSNGTGGTYQLNSSDYGSTEYDQLTGEGNWTLNQTTKILTLTPTKVMDSFAYSGELLTQEEAASIVRETLESYVESTIEYYMDEDFDGVEDRTQAEAEAYFLETENEYNGTNYETVEEYIEGEAARQLGSAFAPRLYTGFIIDGTLVLLEALPVSVGTDELTGKTFTLPGDIGFGGGEDISFGFANGIVTATSSGETATGTYSHDSTTKRVYILQDLTDGLSPAQYFAGPAGDGYDAEYSSSPTEADYRAAQTNQTFTVQKLIYDPDTLSLSYDYGF